MTIRPAIPSALRRRTLGQLAALGAAALLPQGRTWALGPHSDTPFAAGSRLLIPGKSGPFAYVAPRGKPIKLRVAERAGVRWPLAYECESNGSIVTRPTFVVQRGERVRIELQNRLKEPTIAHWHGLGVDSRNDGAGMLLAEPRASFAYDFDVRDRAGLYWYHPHPHGKTAAQAYRGLFGMFVVEDSDDIALRSAMALVPGETEIPLVLQDHRPDALYDPTPMEVIHGYLGDRVFVNGRESPHLNVATRAYRLRILN